ncbi:MAG: choice-of-anchor J domain-containing protein [Prevotellaceae bacterium]|jgi:hypothetical protein|nr:choice-of-anchor J domain-containing protein [Prevotellaceae bacterium]
MKKLIMLIMAALFAMYGVAQTSYTVPFTEDFEGATVGDDYWTFASNNPTINRWMIGSGIGNPGNSLYITNNGSTSGYTISSITFATAYMTVDFGNFAEYSLSFDWAIMAENYPIYDRVQVFIIPSDMTLPTTWTGADASWMSGTDVTHLGTFYGQSSWQHSSTAVNGSVLANKTRKIVFMFWCDANYGNGPVAIDNISITGTGTGGNCVSPSAVAVSNITQTTADISWTAGGSETAWNVIVSPTAITDFTAVIPIATNSNSYAASGLSPSTLYRVYVQADCSSSTSYWTEATPFKTLCGAITTLPWTDNFDSYANGAVPACWTQALPYTYSGKTYPIVANTSSQSGSNSILFGGYVDVMATPMFDADVNTMEVSFWLRRESLLSSGTFEVGVMSNVLTPGTFQSIMNVTPTIESWIYVEVLLNGATAGNHYIAFKQTSTSPFYYWLDDVDVHPLPACLKPTSVSVLNATQTSANISWLADASVEEWNIVVSPVPVTNFTAVTPTATVTTASCNAISLSPNTTYYVYVQANCGTINGTSGWTSAVTFKTLCNAITTLPWSDNFNSYSNGSVPSCWIQVEKYTSGTNVYPRVDAFNHSSPYSLMFYGYVRETMATPMFAADVNTMEVSFWLNKDNTSSGAFEVGVMSNVLDPNTFISIRDVTPTSTASWFYFDVSLVNALAGNHFIAFRQKDAVSNYAAYYYIDDIEVREVLPCAKPIDVTVLNADQTTANISWTAGASETVWNVIVSPTVITDFNAVPTNVTYNNLYYTATGLSPNTQYYLYVQADCQGSSAASYWTQPITFKTLCDAITTLPWIENFDNYTNGTVPSCWTQVDKYTYGTTVYPRVTTTYKYSIPNGLQFAGYVTETMATPMFDADVKNMEVIFWLYRSSANSGTFEVGVMSNPLNTNTFETVLNVTPTVNASWTRIEVPLRSASAGNHFIAFRQRGATSSYSYAIDDVEVREVLPCNKPTDVVVSNEGLTTADISWIADGQETAWNVIVSDTVVTDFTAVTPIATGSNLYPATELTPSTIYYVYVQADCGGSSGTSDWTYVETFRTLCGTIATLPWTNNFDNCAVGYAPYCWTQVQTHTSGSSVYPMVSTYHAHSGSNGIDFHGDGVEVIATPEFTSETNTMEVSFWLRRESLLYSGTFEVGVMSNVLVQGTFESVQDVTPTVEGTWVYVEVPLNGASAGNHFIAFKQNNTTSSRAMFYYWLDDVDVHPIPACLKPTSVLASNIGQTSANISWTAGSSGTAWNIVVSPVPITDFTAVPPIVTPNPYNATGLSSNTTYYVYVQADCGTTDGTSQWATITFKTLCDAVTLPWSDNFDSYANGDVPPCWIQVQKYTAEADIYPRVSNTYYSSPNSLQFYGHVTETMATPMFDTDVNSMEVSFWVSKDNAASGTFEVGVMSDVGNPDTFVPIQNVALTDINTWYYLEVPLAAAYAGNHFIAFRQKDAISSYYYYLDDVDVHALPACPKPTGVTASNVTSSSVDITWGAGASITTWNVLISSTVVTDFNAVTPIVTSNNSYNAAGLTPGTQYYVYVQTDCGGAVTSSWTNAITFKTRCDAITMLPWTDNFDSYALSSVPICWTQVQAYTSGTDVYPRIAATQQYSSPNSLQFGGHVAEVIATPEFTLEANTMEVSFWLRKESASSGTFDVGVMSDPLDPTTFDSIRNVTPTVNATWVYIEVMLNDAPAGNHFIAFRQTTPINFSYWLDDVDVHKLPTCFRPTSVAVSNKTQTSADISWQTGASETVWNVIISDTVVTDFNAVTPAVAPTAFYVASGLSLGTLYYVYVQTDCGAVDGTSKWTQAVTFRTLCGIITALTWSDNFDSYAGGDVPACWVRVQPYTSGTDVYPRVYTTQQHSIPNSLIFYGHGAEVIATPKFAAEANTMDVSFWLRMQNLAYSGTFEVGVMSDVSDPDSFWSILDVTPTTALTWFPVTVSLVNAPAGYHYVAFKQDNTISANTDYYYWIDDVEIISTPIVPPTVETVAATAIGSTTATLNKNVVEGSVSITSQGFKYKTAGGTQWTNRMSTANSLTVTGLAPNTAYEFFAFAEANGLQVSGDTMTFMTEELGTLPTVRTDAATAITQTTATLNKTVTSGTEPVTAEGWRYKAQAAADWIDITDDNGDLTALLANTTYDFFAYALAASEIFTGDTLSFTTLTVGIDTADANEFLIYPNPANSIAMVKVEGLHTSARVTVTDINGKLIETLTINAGNNKAEFDVANYADGTYLVRVVTDNMSKVEKLIVKKN